MLNSVTTSICRTNFYRSALSVILSLLLFTNNACASRVKCYHCTATASCFKPSSTCAGDFCYKLESRAGNGDTKVTKGCLPTNKGITPGNCKSMQVKLGRDTISEDWCICNHDLCNSASRPNYHSGSFTVATVCGFLFNVLLLNICWR